MKRILPLIILLFLVYLKASSQGIVSEDNSWNVMATGFPGFLGTESYMIDGDSSQNGFDYKIIWRTMDSVDASWSYQGLLREDSNIVYFVPPGGTEGILYDFTLEVGDTAWIVNMFCYNYEVPAVVIDIDTVEYYSVDRRRLILYTEWGYPEYWIEGIGSNMGPLHSLYILCIVCPTWELLCFHTSGHLLYQMPGTSSCYVVGIGEEDLQESVQIFPNPAGEKFEVRSAEFGLEKVEIYDLSGKRVFDKQFSDGERNVEVDVSRLDAGMYVCRIILNGHQITRKLLIH